MSDAEIESIYNTARRTPLGSECRQRAVARLEKLIDEHPNRITIFSMCDALMNYGPVRELEPA